VTRELQEPLVLYRRLQVDTGSLQEAPVPKEIQVTRELQEQPVPRRYR